MAKDIAVELKASSKATLRDDKYPIWAPADSSLGGGFNPFEKYAREIESFPQVGVKIKNI